MSCTAPVASDGAFGSRRTYSGAAGSSATDATAAGDCMPAISCEAEAGGSAARAVPFDTGETRARISDRSRTDTMELTTTISRATVKTPPFGGHTGTRHSLDGTRARDRCRMSRGRGDKGQDLHGDDQALATCFAARLNGELRTCRLAIRLRGRCGQGACPRSPMGA